MSQSISALFVLVQSRTEIFLPPVHRYRFFSHDKKENEMKIGTDGKKRLDTFSATQLGPVAAVFCSIYTAGGDEGELFSAKC